MVIIAKSAITIFAEKHPESSEALERWYEFVLRADWGSWSDIKADFASADYVGFDRYVFNIKGNHFRLVALIHFSVRTVYVRFIGTHKQYNMVDVKTI